MCFTGILDISKFDNINDFVDHSYICFQLKFANKETRLKFLNKTIFIDYKNYHFDKNETFWHIISLSGEMSYVKYPQFPCYNTIHLSRCENKCKIKDDNIFYMNKKPRILCLYRASYINYVYDVINMSNENNYNIQIFDEYIYDNNGGKVKRKILRYKDDQTDFVVIFEPKYTKDKRDIDYYKLITAYPVFAKYEMDKFDKGWNESQKRKGRR